MIKSKLALATIIAASLVGGSFLITSCASNYKQESTGQYVDSSAITLKVKSKLLADDFVKGLPITVKTYKNVVQLSGFVDSQAQKARAIAIARSTQGVYAVKDSLVIKSN